MISWLNKNIMPYMIMAGIPTGVAFWQMKDANESLGLTFVIVILVSMVIVKRLVRDWVEDTEDMALKKSKRWKYRALNLAGLALIFKMIAQVSLDIEFTMLVMSGSIFAGDAYINIFTKKA